MSGDAPHLPCSAPNSRRKACFTLLELLVVIAIIAILASLLMPGLRAAKESAMNVVCINQLKQIALGATLYATEEGTYPPQNGDNHWCSVETTQPADTTWWCRRLFLSKCVPDEKVFRCPKAAQLFVRDNPEYAGRPGSSQNGSVYSGGWPVDDQNQIPNQQPPYYCTYMGNSGGTAGASAWPISGGSHPDKRGFCYGGSSNSWTHMPKSDEVDPGTIYCVDGSGRWPGDSVMHAYTNPWISEDTGSMDYGWASRVGDYHPGRRFNAAFADGHVDSLVHGTSRPGQWSIQSGD